MERKVALSRDGCNNVRGGYVLQHGNCNIVLQRFSGVSEADSGQSRPRCNSPRYGYVSYLGNVDKRDCAINGS